MIPINLPEHLHHTYQMLLCAFPQGVEEQYYLPLLAVLREHMSFRSVARVIAAFTNNPYEKVLITEVYGIEDDLRPSGEAIEEVRSKLYECGYYEWISEDELK